MAGSYLIIDPALIAAPGIPVAFTVAVVGTAVPEDCFVTPFGTGLSFSPSPVPIPASGMATFSAVATANGTYTISFTNNSGFTDAAPQSLTVQGGYVGRYTNESSLSTYLGSIAVSVYSDANSQGSEYAPGVAQAIQTAEADVDAYLGSPGSPYFDAVPLTFINGIVPYDLTMRVNMLAAWYLYDKRLLQGIQQDSKAFAIKRAEAMAWLKDIWYRNVVLIGANTAENAGGAGQIAVGWNTVNPPVPTWGGPWGYGYGFGWGGIGGWW